MRTRGLLVSCLVLCLSACGSSADLLGGGNSSGDGESQGATHIPDDIRPSGVAVHGDVSAEPDRVALATIASLQKFWGQEFPKVYGGAYEPLSGGAYAVRPSTADSFPCEATRRELTFNAFYCPEDDLIAWDSEKLLPVLTQKYGPFASSVVLAHEWGHAIQKRAGRRPQGSLLELQADCFAGSWVSHVRKSGEYTVSDTDVDRATAALLALRDRPGQIDTTKPGAHGSGFDRVGAFQDGMDYGATSCKGYRKDHPVVTEIPFESEHDASNNGDQPYSGVVRTVPMDLEDYWSKVFPKISGNKAWTPLRMNGFDPTDPPECDGTRVPSDTTADYCPQNRTVVWDDVKSMPGIYQHDGDFAVATLLARQYGRAVLDDLDDPTKGKSRSLRADCLSGAYAASVFQLDRPASSKITASPGDLDEAVAVLLISGSYPQQMGTGGERVRSYRAGVMGGVNTCLGKK